MQLDPLTFGFEILNFLVLLWLLHRFLYKPIRAAIALRQTTLEDALIAAQTREQSAKQKELEIDQLKANWATEKASQEKALQVQLSEEKDKALDKIRQAAAIEKVRLQTLLAQEQADHSKQARITQIENAFHLVDTFLKRLSGLDLDKALVTLFSEDLLTLSDLSKQQICDALEKQKGQLMLESAHTLGDSAIAKVTLALNTLWQKNITLTTQLDSSLISGIRVSIGALVLHANLGDELRFFKEQLAHE